LIRGAYVIDQPLKNMTLALADLNADIVTDVLSN
jgi:hypothetical protein